MINHLQFLREARVLILNLLNKQIIDIELNESLSQLKVFLDSGETIFIRYNRFGEYGYQIIHSRNKSDFSRFDNYDDQWNVSTHPHHFHIRGGEKVQVSPMNGTPGHDISILVDYIRNSFNQIKENKESMK